MPFQRCQQSEPAAAGERRDLRFGVFASVPGFLALPLYTGPFPMQPLDLKPTHKPVRNYYRALGQFGQLSTTTRWRSAARFRRCLPSADNSSTGRWCPSTQSSAPSRPLIKVDGALLDEFRLARGFWEAKDEHDELEREIAPS